MPSAEPYAVAIVHVPEGKGLAPSLEGNFHTPFEADRYDDPLSAAILFKESEAEREDFGPHAMWMARGNEPARKIREKTILRQLGMVDDVSEDGVS